MELTTKQQLRNCRKNVRRLKEKLTNDSKPDLDELILKYQDALSALSEIKQFTPPDNPTFPQFAKGMCEIYEIFVNDLKGLREL